MKNAFTSVCTENFFEDPHEIIKIAKKIKFKPSKYISGSRTDSLHKIDIDLHQYINKKIISIFYAGVKKIKFTAKTYFQKSKPDKNDGWVHADESTLTAIIYLTPNNTSGTSIFCLKEQSIIPDWKVGFQEKHKFFNKQHKYSEKDKKLFFNKKLKHNNYFEKTINYQGKFNRMVCFDSKQYHSAEVCNKERLILISFIDNIVDYEKK